MIDESGKSVQRLLRDGVARLSACGVVTPGLDARLLLAEACGVLMESVIAKGGDQATAACLEHYEAFLARRMAGEPVSRILGRREFWGLPFMLSPQTLDPRPETDVLVERVLSHCKLEGITTERLRILDLGTGSGCILAALLSELPLATGVAVDLSAEALYVARKNMASLGLRDRAAFLCADWARCFADRSFDIIVSNPPYISSEEFLRLDTEVRCFDPPLALLGGTDGLDCYRSLLASGGMALKPRGFMALEVGFRQGDPVSELVVASTSALGYGKPEIVADYTGRPRVVAVRRHS
jgi:release factor glutamine methyltransferase